MKNAMSKKIDRDAMIRALLDHSRFQTNTSNRIIEDGGDLHEAAAARDRSIIYYDLARRLEDGWTP